MIASLRRILLLAVVACSVIATDRAFAHPHIWVTFKSDLVYTPDGSATGVRHHWTFDDLYSAFALQGITAKKKGQFTREELSPLAKENVTSLKEFDYFTFAEAGGKKIGLKDPVDYYLDYDAKETVLTLHFTVPFKTPVRTKELRVDVYDPEFFIEFSLAEEHPVSLVGAPAACKFSVVRPEDAAAQGQQLPEAFFNSLGASANWGAQFANKITVKCP
jgi:ABC-type uncharacterized transport system substrate-binding protein